MTLLKDEATVRLDDFYRSGMEAVGLFEDIETQIQDERLRSLVAEHAAAQRRVLEDTAELRRARGAMPHAADPERSHLEAAGAFVRAALSAEDDSAAYVDSLLTAADDVHRHTQHALELELAPDLRRLLESFRADNDAFRHALRARRSA